ncbi:hypothetical protein ACU8KH_05726 [Lachancea thermotolerans]
MYLSSSDRAKLEPALTFILKSYIWEIKLPQNASMTGKAAS